MKKILLTLSCILFFAAAVRAEIATIEPQQLTKNDTPKYELINNIAKKVFQNIPMDLDMNWEEVSGIYTNQPVMKDYIFNNDRNYICVEHGQIQLDYNKETKELVKIRVNRQDKLPIRINYNWPSGNLSSVEIYDYNYEKNISDLYVFDAYGKYVDLKAYSTKFQQHLRDCMKGQIPWKYNKITKRDVKVIITVDRTGKITDAKMFRTSGSQEDDARVINAIKDCKLLDAFPKEFPMESLSYMMTFPIFIQHP